MPASSTAGVELKFDEYEVNLSEAAVRRNGVFIPLQEKPLQVLLALLEKPGQVVSREELRNRLWPGDAFGAFEDGLNTAVRKLRIALEDSAESPRFIETVPKRGYRFAAPVRVASSSTKIGVEEQAAPPSEKNLAAAGKSIGRWRIILGAGALLCLLFSSVWFVHRWRAARRAAETPPIASLAVLSFTNLTGDQSQAYFVDGMTDELTTTLAQVSGLRVTSETSAMRYRGTSKTLQQIAAELGVDAIVEGSVTRSGTEIRVNAQLIEAKSDRHLWAKSFDRNAGDVLQLQSELARAIATQVRATVSSAEGKEHAVHTRDPAAFEAYARGRSYVEKWTPEDAREGLKYFQRAIEIDPTFALAYVGEAECYRFGIPGVSPKDSINLAMNALEHALALEPDMGEAHAAVGYLLMLRDWNFPKAEAELRRGIALSPNYAPAHHWYAHLLMNLGRFDESLQESQKLLELDPVSPAASLHLGNQYLASRQWDLAIAQEKKTLQMDPGYVEAHRQLAEAYLGKKMHQEAIVEMRRAAQLAPLHKDYPIYLALLGNIMGQAGEIEDARKILGEIKPANQPLLESYVYGGLGNRDRSIELLNEALRDHSISLEMRFLPEFDPLRGDPGFDELIHRVGLQ